MSTSRAENPVPGVVTFTARGDAALDQSGRRPGGRVRRLPRGHRRHPRAGPGGRRRGPGRMPQRDDPSRTPIDLAAASTRSVPQARAPTMPPVVDSERARQALPARLGHAASTSAADPDRLHTLRYTSPLCNRMYGRPLMLPNPYAPGELPRVLAGREQQQDRIRGYLSRIGTYGEMGGPLLVFLGPRGVGKTSLLREAQRDAEEHGFITAWVACRRNAPFLPDLVSRVGKADRDPRTSSPEPRRAPGSFAWRASAWSSGCRAW